MRLMDLWDRQEDGIYGTGRRHVMFWLNAGLCFLNLNP